MKFRPHSTLGDLPDDRGPESAGPTVGADAPRQRRQAEARARRSTRKKEQFVNRVAMTNREYTVSELPIRALPANINRRYIIIINTGPQTVFVSFTNLANIESSIPIVAGGNYEPWVTPYSEVNIRSRPGTTSTVVIAEAFYENVG